MNSKYVCLVDKEICGLLHAKKNVLWLCYAAARESVHKRDGLCCSEGSPLRVPLVSLKKSLGKEGQGWPAFWVPAPYQGGFKVAWKWVKRPWGRGRTPDLKRGCWETIYSFLRYEDISQFNWESPLKGTRILFLVSREEGTTEGKVRGALNQEDQDLNLSSSSCWMNRWFRTKTGK